MPVTNGGSVVTAIAGAGAVVAQNAGAPVNGVDEVQSLASTATGGTFALTFTNPLTGVSAKTAPIAFNASAATIQAALRALSNMPTAGVVGAGGPLPTAVTLTFAGDLSGIDVPIVVADNALATGGTAVPSTTTAGVSGTERGRGKGSLLSDTTNAILYQNSGTAQKPTWSKVGLQS
jgi:hypothetical protein